MIHDLAHCDDLLSEDGLKIYPYVKNTMHPVIKAVYSHYSRSAHQQRHLMALIESWGADDLFRKLHHLFEVLSVVSEYIAISEFLASFAGIVAGLRLEVKTKSITGALNQG